VYFFTIIFSAKYDFIQESGKADFPKKLSASPKNSHYHNYYNLFSAIRKAFFCFAAENNGGKAK
jgi:hypothetical protein